jgi:hypothetical protein
MFSTYDNDITFMNRRYIKIIIWKFFFDIFYSAS